MKHLLILFTCFVLLLSNIKTAMAQTTLSAGDIVILAVNGDDDVTYKRGFSFMPLVNLSAGTVIYFTDYGWSDVSGAFINNTSIMDKHIKYTSPSSITAGTVIRNSSISNTDFTFEFSYVNDPINYFSLGTTSNSDEVLVYQGSRTSPSFIYAVSYVPSDIAGELLPSGWATNLPANGRLGGGGWSALPPGLTDDVNAISFNQPSAANDNCAYSGPTTAATKTEWQNRISNVSNWTFNDAVPIPAPLTGPFTVTGTNVAPTVTTQAVSTIASNTATGNGNITSLGVPNPTAYGVCWNTTGTPTLSDNKVDKGAASATGAFTASMTSLSANTTYYVRAYATNTAGTSYGDDVSFTTLTNGTFTGNTSSDWATAENWASESIPASATDVTIPAGKTAVIAPGTSANCRNITIDGAGSLTIQSSSASNAGSLIVAGTATGNVTYESYLAETGKWHVVAAPVAAQNIWSFATLAGNSIAANTGKRAVTEYNEGTNGWDTNYPTSDTEGSFAAGSGYSVLRSAAGVVSYTGTLNTSDVSKPLTRTLYGWNALGNPYTSAINATVSAHATNNLITANTDAFQPSFAALYVWDAATNSYVTINNAGTGTLVQNYIQAGQGFFVRAKDNSGLNFSITEAMQAHQTAVPLKSAGEVWPTIELAVTGNGKQGSTVITFNSQMTNGLDVTYDAGMFKADKNFALYSRLVDDNGIDFAIQALPENYDKLVVPLGIDAPAGTQITFSAETMNLPADAAVYLEDRAAKTITKLDLTGAGYTVTVTDKTKGTGNFFIHTSAATTAINELENNLKVFTRDNAIYISGNLETTDVVAVYSIVGKLYYKKAAEKTGMLRIDASKMPAGIYLVSISRNNTNSTQKVIISE